MADQPDRIQWHLGFYGAAELELRANADDLIFIQEHSLSKEPLRADLLIIRKKPEVQIVNEIGKIFRGYNIIEYKSPDDGLTIDDFFKTAAYACLYKSLGQTVDQYPGDDITVSLFREAYPRELFAALRSSGRRIEKHFPGIYYVTGSVMFDTQIVVMSELDRDSHSPLRILSRGADRADIRRFLEESSALAAPGDRNNADAVLQVSISANRSLYDDLRKEDIMCEALEDLMKDVIEERVNEAVNEAVSQAVKLNTDQVTKRVTEEKDREMAVKLLRQGMSLNTIADLIGRSKDVILQWVSPASQV